MVIRIRIEQDKCVGAGHCVRAAPEIFDQREDDGIVVLLMAEAPDARVADVQKAERLCPAQAIRIEINE